MNTLKAVQNNTININAYNTPSVFSQFERSMNLASKSVVYNPEIKSSKKRKIFTITSISALIIIIALSLASRKLRVDATKLLENLKNTNEELLNQAQNALSSKDVSLLFKAKVHTLRFFNQVSTSTINFLANLDHGKNFITGKVSDEIPLLKKTIGNINSKLQPFFQNTVKSATFRKYQAADKAAIELQKTLAEIALKNPQAKSFLGNYGDDIVDSVAKLSKRTAFEGRTKDLNKQLEKAVVEYKNEIQEMIDNPAISKTANKLLNRTISLDIAKTKLHSHNLNIHNLKKVVTLTTKERIGTLNTLLREISYGTKVKLDTNLVNNLSKTIADYSKQANPATESALNAVLEEVTKKISDPKIRNLVLNAKTAISGSTPGLAEELLTSAGRAFENGNMTAEEYKLLTGQINNLRNSVNKAVTFEKENLAGRFLDINIGPVPFLETISLGVPVVALAVDCHNSENKQERNSKLIQYAPTIAGGSMGWLYASLKGFFGFKALMFSLVSGYAFNKLGIMIDDKFYSKGKEFNTTKILTSNNPEKQGLKVIEA